MLFTLKSAVCYASECGLKVVVEDSKCVQANAFVGSDIFQVSIISVLMISQFTFFHFPNAVQEYKIANEEDTAIFRIDLNILVDCLTIFDGCSTTAGVTTALKMLYEGCDNPLKIM